MVYGENEPHALAKIIFLLRHRMFPLINKGRFRLHMVYVKNVSGFMIQAMDDDRFVEGSFFIADRDALSAREVFGLLSEGSGAPRPWAFPRYIEPLILRLPFIGRKFGIFNKDWVYSIDRLTSLGFNPPYNARESLLRTGRSFSRQANDSEQGPISAAIRV